MDITKKSPIENTAEQWKAIESQHELLLGIVEELEVAVTAPRPAVKFELLARLDAYVVLHFTTEETLMAQTEYPDLLSHRSEHESIRATLPALRKAFAAGAESAALDFLRTIREWTRTHRADADRRLCEYLEARARSANGRRVAVPQASSELKMFSR